MELLVAFLLLWGVSLGKGEFSDTSNKSNSTCPESSFLCRHSQECISTRRVCDGFVDCKDMSDELWCQMPHQDTNQCGESQFKCINVSQCIMLQFRCDGYVDCRDYSDEFNCTEIRGRAQPSPFSRTLSYALPPLLIIVLIFFCHQASRKRSSAPWLSSRDLDPTENVQVQDRENHIPVLPAPEVSGNDVRPETTPVEPPKYEEALSDKQYDTSHVVTMPPSYLPPPYDMPQTVNLPPLDGPPAYQTVLQGQTQPEPLESQSTHVQPEESPLIPQP